MVAKVWVYYKTGTIYPSEVNVALLVGTKEKKGEIVEGKLMDDTGNMAHLEYITKGAQSKRADKVWVYYQTDRLYEEPFEITDLTPTKVAENGLVVAGKLIDNSGAVIHLEYISKATQLKRANMVWVYHKTDRLYEEAFEMADLAPTKVAENGLVIAGKLTDNSGREVHLEYITKEAQRKRADKVWVYHQTDCPYEASFEVADLTEITLAEDGSVVAGKLTDDFNNMVHLEYITKGLQQQRAGIWVYHQTDIPYGKLFELDALMETQLADNGLVVNGKLIDDSGNQFHLEYIKKTPRRKQADKVWVYFQTDRPYEELFEINALTPTKIAEDGSVVAGKLIDSAGEEIHLEYVKKAPQFEHANNKVWVYYQTDRPYDAPFEINDLIPTKVEKNGSVIAGKLIDVSSGKEIHLESITKYAQSQRAGVWVHYKSDCLYKEPFEVNTLTPTKVAKNGSVVAGKLVDASSGKEIHLEYISKSALRQRATKIWVYSKTAFTYDAPFNIADLIDTKKAENGSVIAGSLIDDSGNLISLEYITKAALHERDGVWVYYKSDRQYEEFFDIAALTATKIGANNLVVAGKLIDDLGNEIHLEYISKVALQKRSRKNQSLSRAPTTLEENISSTTTTEAIENTDNRESGRRDFLLVDDGLANRESLEWTNTSNPTFFANRINKRKETEQDTQELNHNKKNKQYGEGLEREFFDESDVNSTTFSRPSRDTINQWAQNSFSNVTSFNLFQSHLLEDAEESESLNYKGPNMDDKF